MNPVSGPQSGFGETVTTTVTHQPANGGTDCLTWGAVVFSTSVADVDNDGLPDGLENSTSGLNDPPSPDAPTIERPLPNLNAMGASSGHKDLFVEVGAMRANAGTAYGGQVDPNGHHHLPTPEDIKRIGDAYAARGITPHFDVGPLSVYKALPTVQHADWQDVYNSNVADAYLIAGSGLARGGEIITETACAGPPSADCQFPDWPGTVAWKSGFHVYKDAPVKDDGTEVITPADLTAWNAGATKRRRFDRNRRGLMHYVLNVHARGKPESPFPCKDGSGGFDYYVPDTTVCGGFDSSSQ